MAFDVIAVFVWGFIAPRDASPMKRRRALYPGAVAYYDLQERR